ncbi:MAG: YceI family protein [Bacteroidetes bacterium]|nr:MAG: YceI family protein [Bacteroidota bacterium]
MIRSLCTALLIALLSWTTASAQTLYRVSDGTEFFVDGTSNIHDWTATVGTVEGSFVISEAYAQKGKLKPGTAFSGGSLSIPVASLDGGKGETMNNKILAAFDAPSHPNIRFELGEATVAKLPQGDQNFPVSVSGQLSMAGQTHPVTLSLTGSRQADGSYRFTGKHDILMTSFGMEPPTALFGQIATGDKVVIRINLVLKGS